ncbi:hypothetical protein HNV08_03065 [Winogradskyella eckloniae]|uniref:hypothetical protein n=1 Tax=Winogradskyella eckloniae TaxID=1089306 RepID=UPI0015657A1F|nr:hypothetical protein [Winogradskyella eckloniae]NRD19015.1 hypothetical protein [Winogradskyella eckloniae]
MKILKQIILVFTLSAMSFSCGSDDDGGSSNSNGVLIYGDTEYQLKAGIIEDYGEYYDGLYNFDISLATSEIIESDGVPVPEDNIFSGVYFELFTSNSSDLAEGTYAFGDNVEVNSYTYANLFIDSSIENNNAISINSGTFTVLENGSTYEFSFQGTSSDGTSFSGSYTGSLQSYDYTDEFDRPATTSSVKTSGRAFRK